MKTRHASIQNKYTNIYSLWRESYSQRIWWWTLYTCTNIGKQRKDKKIFHWMLRIFLKERAGYKWEKGETGTKGVNSLCLCHRKAYWSQSIKTLASTPASFNALIHSIIGWCCCRDDRALSCCGEVCLLLSNNGRVHNLIGGGKHSGHGRMVHNSMALHVVQRHLGGIDCARVTGGEGGHERGHGGRRTRNEVAASRTGSHRHPWGEQGCGTGHHLGLYSCCTVAFVGLLWK